MTKKHFESLAKLIANLLDEAAESGADIWTLYEPTLRRAVDFAGATNQRFNEPKFKARVDHHLFQLGYELAGLAPKK